MLDTYEGGQPTVGRGAELEEIEALLDSLQTGDSGFLEVVGEPGIGKSTLLAALIERAEARGLLALRGRASQFELETPFDPFVDALDDYLATINPRRWEPLGPERMGELGSAFPSIAELVEEPGSILPSEERYRIHRSVRSLLGLIGAAQPLALVLDDTHWSDQASLELLRHLVRRPPEGPVLVVIAYRTGTMPGSWDVLSDAALREGDLERIEVGPLGRADADALIAGRVSDPALRERVFEAAGGNPFFMRQVAEAPQVVAASGAAARSDEGVPRAVLAAIGEEVAALRESTRVALQAAAVAGDPFDPGLAAAAAGIDEAELLPELDELARRGLVRPGDSPRRFSFRHPLVWRGVYEDAPPGWRLSAHRRLADHLAELGASAASRAPHVEAAARPGDGEAIALLREAADATLAQAPASAVHWLDAALRLLPEGAGATEERISILVPMAKTLGSIGRLEESRDRLREAYALIPPEAETARVEAVVGWATMEVLMRNLRTGTRLLTEALEGLSDPDSEQAAEILVALATLHIFDLQGETTRDWGRRALEVAERLGLEAIEAAAAGALAYNVGRIGAFSEALALIDRAAPLADAVSIEVASTNLGAVFWITAAEMQVERWEDAIRHGERARAIARATDQGRWLPQIASGIGWSQWGLGRVEDSVATGEEGVEMAELTGNRHFAALTHLGSALFMTPAGRLREAMAAGRRAIEIAGPVDEGDHIAIYARQNAAVPTLESGDPVGARDLMLEIADSDGFPRTEPPWQQVGLGVLTGAELALGDVDAAERYARRSVETAEAGGLPGRISSGLHALASVQLARGDARDAAATASEAAEAASKAKARVDQGRALVLLGQALAAADDEAAAVTVLRRAHDLLDACGAAHFRDQAARDLRHLGIRVGRGGRPRNASGAGALSPREREIAELVAEGRTNKEIAAALYLSPKTVEKHLSKAFQKLEVSRRAQVAAAIGRERSRGFPPGEGRE